MVATTGFYLYPYFCFQKHANSNNGLSCGFDIGPVTTVTAVAEVLHQPHVPKVIAVVGVAATATTATTAEVVVVTGVPKILEVVAVPEVLAVIAQPPVQHDLHGIFQHQILNWNSQIWIAMLKPDVPSSKSKSRIHHAVSNYFSPSPSPGQASSSSNLISTCSARF